MNRETSSLESHRAKACTPQISIGHDRPAHRLVAPSSCINIGMMWVRTGEEDVGLVDGARSAALRLRMGVGGRTAGA